MKNLVYLHVLLYLLHIYFCKEQDLNHVFVILTQNNKFHIQMAEKLKEELLKKDSSIIYFSHIDFPHVGSWTVLPLISKLLETHEDNTSWFVFLHDNTHVNVDSLNEVLLKYDYNDKIWLGHVVHDREPSITHHFDFKEEPNNYVYPISSPGFAISLSLFRSIGENSDLPFTDFSIDFIYELSKIIQNVNGGATLIHESSFCPVDLGNCSTYPIVYYPCTNNIAEDNVYFAVKTYHGFHSTRLPIVKATWAKYTDHVGFFSDVKDEKFDTLSVNVPNSDSGHCTKTMKIIEYVADIMEKNNNYKWLFLVDDDTILSPSRLKQFLTCYDEKDNIAIGERYGYSVVFGMGYNYLTGGAGILLSKPLVQILVNEGCYCPSISSPDDMVLGLCLKKLEVDVIHSPYFHQARPNDYTPEYLSGQKPITFHKYWMVDPHIVYRNWFLEDDTKRIKDEL